jgi:hypothetical protein
MDTQVYISILREHSEHIGEVAAELSAQLQQLARTLGEPPSTTPRDTAACFAAFAPLQQRLLGETEMLCKRLLAFVEKETRQFV